MGEPGSSAGSSSCGGAEGGAGVAMEPDLSTMTADELKRFIDTGRTGRRNALPDVSEQGAISTSTAGMAEAMNSLSFQSGESWAMS